MSTPRYTENPAMPEHILCDGEYIGVVSDPVKRAELLRRANAHEELRDALERLTKRCEEYLSTDEIVMIVDVTIAARELLTKYPKAE
jgi:hypothetical protein